MLDELIQLYSLKVIVCNKCICKYQTNKPNNFNEWLNFNLITDAITFFTKTHFYKGFFANLKFRHRKLKFLYFYSLLYEVFDIVEWLSVYFINSYFWNKSTITMSQHRFCTLFYKKQLAIIFCGIRIKLTINTILILYVHPLIHLSNHYSYIIYLIQRQWTART